MTLYTDLQNRKKLSIVVPIYLNEQNVVDLVSALNSLSKALDGIEVVFVIDGSPDHSAEQILSLESYFNFSAQIIYHSRNFGSFTAIRTGLEFARGDLIAVMAADLQEPPELIETMFQVLESDSADVVFGKRVGRDDSLIGDTLSNIFWGFFAILLFPPCLRVVSIFLPAIVMLPKQSLQFLSPIARLLLNYSGLVLDALSFPILADRGLREQVHGNLIRNFAI